MEHIKLLSGSAKITALSFGPYDNGHILLGLNTGHLLILSPINLDTLLRIQAF